MMKRYFLLIVYVLQKMLVLIDVSSVSSGNEMDSVCDACGGGNLEGERERDSSRGGELWEESREKREKETDRVSYNFSNQNNCSFA